MRSEARAKWMLGAIVSLALAWWIVGRDASAGQSPGADEAGNAEPSGALDAPKREPGELIVPPVKRVAPRTPALPIPGQSTQKAKSEKVKTEGKKPAAVKGEKKSATP